MAVTQCIGCGRNVSAQLIICPDCGTPVGYSGGTPTSKKGVAVRLHNSQDYEGAVAAFTEVIGLDPNDEGAYRLRANAYRRLGREEEAEADLQKAAEIGRLQAPPQISVSRAVGPTPMRQRSAEQSQPRPPVQPSVIREFGDMPGGVWVALGALVVALVGLFLPWVKVLGFIPANAFDIGIAGIIMVLLIIAATILIVVKLGYRSVTEFLPSGEPRDIPHLKVWIALISTGIVGLPILVVAQEEYTIGVGVWVDMIAGITLWLSSLSGYERG